MSAEGRDMLEQLISRFVRRLRRGRKVHMPPAMILAGC